MASVTDAGTIDAEPVADTSESVGKKYAYGALSGPTAELQTQGRPWEEGKGFLAEQSDNRQDVRSTVREYLLSDVLSGEEPDALKDTTELVSSGILDSISTARLVSYLEGEFGIRFKASEIGAAHLNTVDLIVRTVESKRNV